MHLPEKRTAVRIIEFPFSTSEKKHTQKSETVIETASALIKALVRDSKPLDFV
jgi:hypothetical protein